METIKLIVRILGIFEKNMDSGSDIISKVLSESSKISERRFVRIMEIMSDGELIKGVNVNITNNIVHFSDPRITLRGLEYLHKNL